MLRRSATIGLLAVALAAAPIAASAQNQEQPAVIKVDAVVTEPLSQTFPVIGRLVARQSGVIAARVAGPVLEVVAHVGDRVETGDAVAILDAEELTIARDLADAEVEAAQAFLASAQSAQRLAQQEVARLEQLRQSGSAAFPKARYEDAQEEVVGAGREVARARALVAQAASRAQMAQVDLDRAIIRAPYPGVVTRRHTDSGAWLDIGDPVVDLVNDIDVEIEVDVPSDRVIGLAPGIPVAITLDDNTQHTAHVRAVVTDENPLTRTRPVRFVPDIGATNKPLAINQSVTVHIPVGQPRQVVSVHKDAIVNRQGQSLVYVVEEQSASMRPVVLGVAIGGRFEVLQGLQPGDLVVVRGNERLRPGQPVTIDRES